MQFLVIAHDGTDAQALERRLAAREAHLEHARGLRDAGVLHLGGAVLDDTDRMIGSALVVEVASEAELHELLEADPYRRGEVWKRFDVLPFRRAL